LIEFEELNEEKTIFLNIGNSIHYPESKNMGDNISSLFSESDYGFLQVAKKGKLKNRPTYYFEKTVAGIDLKITIIKEEEKYIVSVKQPENIDLTDINGIVLKETTPNLYDELTGGLYFISINGIENEIRIRLK